MSKMDELMAKPEKHRLGGLELEFVALDVKEMNEMEVDTSVSKDLQKSQATKLLFRFLQKAIPDCTFEEFEKMSSKYLDELSSIFRKVHKENENVPSGIKK